MSRYDWLLFLHVLSAFAIVGSVVAFTVVILGARRGGEGVAALRLVPLARRLWDVGGAGTLVLGIWLAIDLDGYGLFDGWVLGAIVLWAVAAYAGVRLGLDLREGESVANGRASLLYWVMAAAVTALLVVMIYKPGA